MIPSSLDRPEFAITSAVALLHERGLQGVRINANFYATGNWRCRVFVPEPRDPSEQNILLDYTSGSGWDPFPTPTVEGIADAFAEAAAAHRAARRADPEYAAWLAELRERTGGGSFVMWEDAYSREHMWEERGLVRLLYADPAAAARDEAAHRGLDGNGWSLVGTMLVPPVA